MAGDSLDRNYLVCYQVSVSKPNALALGCRHRLIVLDHKSEKYLAFPLKCGILLIALLVEKTGAMLKEVHNAHLQIQVRLS